MTALLTHYGHWVQPPRRQATGPAPKPRWMPLPQLLYAQVVKTVRRRRLVDVQHRVVFGSLEAVNHVLAPLGWHINTAFVERINLTIRQHVAAVGRRVSTLCKGEDGLRQQLAVFHCYDNFADSPGFSGKMSTFDIVEIILRDLATEHRVSTGNQGVSCSHHRRPIGLPLNPGAP